MLALYSAPDDTTRTPSWVASTTVTSGQSAEYRRAQRPLFDRAVLGLYAPASTWKLASAGIALDLGRRDARRVSCPTRARVTWYWGNRFWGCWDREGHGHNTLAEAIGNSCDVYFYQLGLRLGLQALLDRSIEIGFTPPVR